MKHFIRSFFYHSSIEKTGILTLLISIAVLTTTLFMMTCFTPGPASLKTDEKLLSAWNQFKTEHSPPENVAFPSEINERPLFAFDPNTLDSTGFLKLGLKPHTTKLLLNWRRKGKVFYKKEEFKKLYTLTEEEYDRLAPYMVIRQAPEKRALTNTGYTGWHVSEPAAIDINTADSATLVKLRGIGAFLAHKLIARRNSLGGYIKPEQFLEAYRFNDSIFQMLKEKLIIRTGAVHKINLNTATETQLSAHPYIGEQTAKNILLYRNATGRFEKTEQLRRVPLMNEEIYRKIVPYLIIE